jgi:hypothetical protein
MARALAASGELDVYGGNISAAWLDAYSLRSAARRERDRGAKGGGAKFAFEPPSRDTSGHLPGNAT